MRKGEKKKKKEKKKCKYATSKKGGYHKGAEIAAVLAFFNFTTSCYS